MPLSGAAAEPVANPSGSPGPPAASCMCTKWYLDLMVPTEAEDPRGAPRPVRLIERTTLQEWRVKVYGISLASQSVRDELVASGLAAASASLPPSVDNDGLGAFAFVVLHDAPDHAYALVHWWAGGNEVHQRVFSAPRSHPEDLRPHPSDAIGCVWELSVVDFERRAWLDCVVRRSADPDLETYFQRTFCADV